MRCAQRKEQQAGLCYLWESSAHYTHTPAPQIKLQELTESKKAFEASFQEAQDQPAVPDF